MLSKQSAKFKEKQLESKFRCNPDWKHTLNVVGDGRPEDPDPIPEIPGHDSEPPQRGRGRGRRGCIWEPPQVCSVQVAQSQTGHHGFVNKQS